MVEGHTVRGAVTQYDKCKSVLHDQGGKLKTVEKEQRLAGKIVGLHEPRTDERQRGICLCDCEHRLRERVPVHKDPKRPRGIGNAAEAYPRWS